MNRRYFAVWAFSASLIAFTLGVFTLVIDPYGLYGHFQQIGLNQQKEGVRSKIRFVKALELPLRTPQTLIMGSSRVHDAMNPMHPLLQEYAPVYNLGVDMNRIHETLLLLRHATENAKIKRVVIGLDFFMFNSLVTKNPDFDEHLIGRRVQISDYLPTVFSSAAVQDAWVTAQTSHLQPLRREFLPNGFRPQAFYLLKNHPAIHYYTNWIFLTPKPQGTIYYSKMALNEAVFEDFEALLKLCAQNGIDVHLYINPAHCHLDGEGIRAVGKWAMFENWKRRITSIAYQHHVPLWDFSGYNSVTTEKVESPMKYYWDSSHFTEIVSDWIIKRIFDKSEEVPSDFGVLLSPQNIESHLELIKASREKYIRSNKLEMDRIQADYFAIINGAPLDANRAKGAF
jgi:hypothetical protein